MTGHIMIRGAKIPLEETSSKNQLEVTDENPSDFVISETIKWALVASVDSPDLNTNISETVTFEEGLAVDSPDLNTNLTEAIAFTNT